MSGSFEGICYALPLPQTAQSLIAEFHGPAIFAGLPRRTSELLSEDAVQLVVDLRQFMRESVRLRSRSSARWCFELSIFPSTFEALYRLRCPVSLEIRGRKWKYFREFRRTWITRLHRDSFAFSVLPDSVEWLYSRYRSVERRFVILDLCEPPRLLSGLWA